MDKKRGSSRPYSSIPRWWVFCVNLSKKYILFSPVGQPCDEDGYDLAPGTPPPPFPERQRDDYWPYDSEAHFELADFLYRKEQMSANKIDELMEIWAGQQLGEFDDDNPSPPFANARDLYDVIDATELGDVPWQAFSVTYNGDAPDNAPGWMSKPYEVWFRDPLLVMESQIGNRDFENEMDCAPKKVFSRTRTRQYCDFMSGDWAWNQAVRLLLFCVAFWNSNSIVGYHCRRSGNAWFHVCTCDSG